MPFVPVAQLDRASASEAEGYWFESSRGYLFVGHGRTRRNSSNSASGLGRVGPLAWSWAQFHHPLTRVPSQPLSWRPAFCAVHWIPGAPSTILSVRARSLDHERGHRRGIQNRRSESQREESRSRSKQAHRARMAAHRWLGGRCLRSNASMVVLPGDGAADSLNRRCIECGIYSTICKAAFHRGRRSRKAMSLRGGFHLGDAPCHTPSDSS